MSSRPTLGSTQPPVEWVPGAFPGNKATGAWNCPLTSSKCRGLENVDLCIHFFIRLHGVVLNYLSTGTTFLPTRDFLYGFYIVSQYTRCSRSKGQCSGRSYYRSFYTEVCVYMCAIPNGYRDTAISLYSTLDTVQTSNTPCPHTSCKVLWCCRCNFRKCITRGILGKLYQTLSLKQLIPVLETVRNLFLINNFGTVQWNSSISETVLNRTCIYVHFFCFEWPILWLLEYSPFLLGHPVFTISIDQKQKCFQILVLLRSFVDKFLSAYRKLG
jgi:hypothetical protein